MRTPLRRAVVFLTLLLSSALLCVAQTGSTSGTIMGTVTDPTGAVLPGATVAILNPVSQYQRTASADSAGHFQFTNVPFNSYHMTVNMTGFGSFARDVDVKSAAVVTVPVTLTVGTTATTVEVTGEDLMNNASTMDTEVDRKAFAEIPLESASSGLSSLVASEITRRISFPSMVNRLRISRARRFRTSCRTPRCSRCR
jgi:hypothetical protein